MNIGGLGAFAGGIGQGIEQGLDIRQRRQQLAEYAAMQAAKKVYEQFLNSPITGGPQMPSAFSPPASGAQPSAPNLGQPTAPAGGGLAALQTAQRGTVAPIATPVPKPGATGPLPAGGGMTPAPSTTAPQPSPIGAGSGPAAPDFQSQKIPTFQEAMAQGKEAVRSVAREIAAANPGHKWKPGELLDAVQMALKDQKELDPLAFQSATAQIRAAQAQAQFYEKWQAHQLGEEKESDTRARDQARAEVQMGTMKERIRHDQSLEHNSAARTQLYGEFIGLTHEDRQAAIAAANERHDKSLAASMSRLDKAIQDKDWATVENIRQREFSAETANAPIGKTPAKPAITPPPSSRATSPVGAPKPDQAKVLTDARAAIKRGAPRAQVIKRLQDAGYPTAGL